MHSSKSRKWNYTKLNCWYDLAIFVAALLAPALFLTGLTIHEWLGIGLAIAVIAHLLLHWSWIVQITRRFFARTQWSARINYVLNLAFFIDMTVIIFTGLLISKVALPMFGIAAQSGFQWRALHTLSSDAMIFILALHVALHWKWILSASQRYLLQPVLRPVRRLATRPAHESLDEGVVS
jgi:hypothetical protein